MAFAKLHAGASGPAQVPGGLAPFPGTAPASWEAWQVRPQHPLTSGGSNGSPASKGCCNGDRKGTHWGLCSVPGKPSMRLPFPHLRVRASQTVNETSGPLTVTAERAQPVRSCHPFPRKPQRLLGHSFFFLLVDSGQFTCPQRGPWPVPRCQCPSGMLICWAHNPAGAT